MLNDRKPLLITAVVGVMGTRQQLEMPDEPEQFVLMCGGLVLSIMNNCAQDPFTKFLFRSNSK